jgi:hypothetical protein
VLAVVLCPPTPSATVLELHPKGDESNGTPSPTRMDPTYRLHRDILRSSAVRCRLSRTGGTPAWAR